MASVAQSITNAIRDKIVEEVLKPFMDETRERLDRLEKNLEEMVDLFINGPDDDCKEEEEEKKITRARRTNKELEAPLERIDVIERPIRCVTPLGKRPRNASVEMEDGIKYGATLPHHLNNVGIMVGDLLTCTALIDRENKKLLRLKEVTVEQDFIPAGKISS